MTDPTAASLQTMAPMMDALEKRESPTRTTAAEAAKTLGIDGLKLVYLESILNVEWHRGHQAGLLQAQRTLFGG